jgi:hypothetical protein
MNMLTLIATTTDHSALMADMNAAERYVYCLDQALAPSATKAQSDIWAALARQHLQSVSAFSVTFDDSGFAA